MINIRINIKPCWFEDFYILLCTLAKWLQKANNMYNMKILFVLCIAFLQPSEGNIMYI